MRLLFDSNISHRLRETLGEMYPESIHVREIGLESAADAVVWTYVKDHESTIVSTENRPAFSDLGAWVILARIANAC